MKKAYGRVLYTKVDREGRRIHLYLNIYKHIINYHDKLEIWVKHWADIIENVAPEKKDNTWFYNKLIDGLRFQIRVVQEKGTYLIKTAIMSEGYIGKFRRSSNV